MGTLPRQFNAAGRSDVIGCIFSSELSVALYQRELYLLVFALAAGYAAALLVIDMLDRYSAKSETAHSGSALIGAFARTRWYWIPPLYGLTLLVVSILTHTQGAGAAQFMYRRF